MPSIRALPVLPLLLALTQSGCHDSETKAHNLLNEQTTVSANLFADPSEHFRKINLFITQVDVKAGADWKPLASPGRVFDLQNPAGREEPIASRVRLVRGDYEQLRVVVDPARSSVELPDGSSHPLALPADLRAGFPVTVMEGPATDNLVYDLILNLDAGRSVHRTQDPAGGFTYTFRPLARLNDRNALGSISGRLVDQNQQPLANVTVMAQDGEGEQGRSLVRSARTRTDGTYTLDLLPIRRMYYVVAQPRAGSRLFAAQASPGFRPTRLERTRIFDFPPFQPATEAAGPAGAITLPTSAQQCDVLDLLQELTTGDRPGTFIIQSTQALTATGGGPGSFQFAPVPVGTYHVRLTRATYSTREGHPILNVSGQQRVELQAGTAPRKVDF